MTIDQFTHLARTYGSQVARWPEELHALFAQWAHTPEGQVILAEEEMLDGIWSLEDVGMSVSPALQNRIVSISQRGTMEVWQQRFWRISAYGYAACILLGIMCGAQINAAIAEDRTSAEVSLFDNDVAMLIEVLS